MFQELPKFMFYDLQKFLDDKIKVIMGTPIDPVFLKLLSRRYIIQSLQFILDCDQSWQTYFPVRYTFSLEHIALYHHL